MSTFIDKFTNQTILIPRLQREYVQGNREDVISPFLDDLLKSNAELTYIYGYEEDGCFVPVDGQQRLTTLWLLHVYVASKIGKLPELGVKLKFLSREFANDFCSRLLEHMPKLLQVVSPSEDLAKFIKDENWFISSWNSSPTVKNMLKTLRYIHQKAPLMKLEDFWNTQNTNTNIVFSYLEMKADDGLDDDIYVKMNGRGRPLSSFENLKAWMDERLPNSISDDWQKKMDNHWTNLFWTNRNRNQDLAEEIDDEQMYCFCNLSLIYWHRHADKLLHNIIELKENPYLYEELLEALHCEESKQEPIDVFGKLCDKWQKGEMLHLVWLDRLKLFPVELFQFIHNSLDQLCNTCQSINSLGVFFGTIDTDEESTLYHLSMTNGTYDRTLPLLYALLAYSKHQLCSLKDWMRTIRNLVLNTDIGSKKIAEIFECIDRFAETIGKRNVYEVLAPNDKTEKVKSLLSAFDDVQIEEEIKKADKKYIALRDEMLKLENNSFFRGRIKCIFDLMRDEDGFDQLTLENLQNYSLVLRNIFIGNGANPIQASLEGSTFYLRRAMIYYDAFGICKKSGYWYFCNDSDEWQQYVNQYGGNGPIPTDALQHVIKDLCIPAVQQEGNETVISKITTALKKFVEGISISYDNDVEGAVGLESKHKYHFIHHPYIWQYMTTKIASWSDDDFKIYAKTSEGNNSNRMNLRTFGIYLDYKGGPFKKDREDWNISKYEKVDDRCAFSIFDENGMKLIMTVLHRCRKEDDYAFELYIDKNQLINESAIYYEPNERVKRNLDYLQERYPGIIEKYNLVSNTRLGRWESSESYSRAGVISLLRELFEYLKEPIILANGSN